MITRGYFFQSAIITLIVIVMLPLAAASSQNAAKVTGHVTISKQLTSTQTPWLQGPIPPEYDFWIIKVDVKNNNYPLICPTWPHILNDWVITNDDPAYPKESYPIYCLAVQALSKSECISEGKSGQFMVLYAIPPVKNFNNINLVWDVSSTWLPNLYAYADLVLDAVVSDYDWDTKTITDPDYKPQKGFPTALVLTIGIVAFIFAAPLVYIGIKRIRRDARAGMEQRESTEIGGQGQEEEEGKKMRRIWDEMYAREQKRLFENEKAESERDKGLETPIPSQTYEADIQEFIVKNIGLLEHGLQVIEQHKKIYKDNKVVGEIDILCRDMNGDYVVVELKRGIAKREVAGQIAQYLGWVEENSPKEKKARGIIVASEIDVQLELALIPFGSKIQKKLFRDIPPLERNMRHCDKCGKIIPKSSHICSHCGNKLWM